MAIEPHVPEPKYVAVKHLLLDIIAELGAGAALPTERALAQQCSTSRTTVRQAINELVVQGRIVRRQGAGNFVADGKMNWPLYLASFTEQAAANGMVATSQTIGTKRERANAEVAERLAVEPGDPVYRLDRLRIADGVPMCVETSVLSADRFPGLSRRIRSVGSLHSLLGEQYDVELTRGEETIQIEPATPRVAGLLDLDVGAPLLVVRRHSFDKRGTPVEWGTTWMRGDGVVFVAHLEVRRS
ncbi:GntR family transcriptional regulator [Rudaeicoccus suwonensis]|uniref:GntR family transcriptional regulator n=1 Tax=Rudaeicoccus suwonensis TaxID=657409 RepID=A0A561E6K8_9MICO|nr:GntR family transcriptional regulator [Rudaeicoccus suwonensis]TWE11249.1 GntR family transcriptional regulator [Rudaeicoccus suwonensis]